MQRFGIAHVWAQGDFVTCGIAVMLAIMAVLSWSVMIAKCVNAIRLKRLAKDAEALFWSSGDFGTGVQRLSDCVSSGARNPFLALTLSGQLAAGHRQARSHLHDRLNASDWMTRCLNDSIDESVVDMQRGLTVLASIGSTAPFVGLLGTVWGIYHALLEIGSAGQASIEQVAGPVGESLIMTAFGLLVAIPAVLAYNALVRQNGSVTGRLHRFAHGLHAYFVTGASLRSLPR
jgi:biopolymer transport protein ExbB